MPEVLIIGAGPSGLVLALWLAKAGVAVRIVDAAAGPGETSRAIGVHARTLEYYRQLGIADAVVAAGTVVRTLRFRLDGKSETEVPLGRFGVIPRCAAAGRIRSLTQCFVSFSQPPPR